MNSINKSVTILLLALAPILCGIIAVNAEDNTNTTFTIDDMKDATPWINGAYTDNVSSIKITPTDSGLKIAYDLKKENSYVGTTKEIDFSNFHEYELSKIKYYYTGSGAPNTLKLGLLYKDRSDTEFEKKQNSATNTSV